MSSKHHPTQLTEAIAHHAADFLVRESSHQSLITVTRAELSPDLKEATIFLSVLPESAERTALAFAKRERSAFRDYVKAKSAMQHIPTFDFELDLGEKNRRRIDDLTRN
jgi:ribosome-binding factor A